jgi:hypothetical protein
MSAATSPAPAQATPPPSAAAPAPAPAAPADGPPLDAIYEHVVGRLRRDLLLERERMGALIGGRP